MLLSLYKKFKIMVANIISIFILIYLGLVLFYALTYDLRKVSASMVGVLAYNIVVKPFMFFFNKINF